MVSYGNRTRGRINYEIPPKSVIKNSRNGIAVKIAKYARKLTKTASERKSLKTHNFLNTVKHTKNINKCLLLIKVMQYKRLTWLRDYRKGISTGKWFHRGLAIYQRRSHGSDKGWDSRRLVPHSEVQWNQDNTGIRTHPAQQNCQKT